MAMIVLNDYIFVRQCINDHIRDENGEVLIWRPDGAGEWIWHGANDTSNWAEIIDVGTKCKLVTRNEIGTFCLIPEFAEGLERYSDDEFFVREDTILPAVVEG